MAVLALALGGAYFKGRLDAERSMAQKELANNAKAMEAAATAATTRAAADDAARQKATDFIAQVDQGIANVNAKFAKLPRVMLDARGCERLSPSSSMRWNSVELLPTGSTANPAGSAPASVPAAPVPAAR